MILNENKTKEIIEGGVPVTFKHLSVEIAESVRQEKD